MQDELLGASQCLPTRVLKYRKTAKQTGLSLLQGEVVLLLEVTLSELLQI